MRQIRKPVVLTILVRNESWGGAELNPGNIDEIVYTPISNSATRVAALLSGELSFVLDPPPQDLARVKRTSGLKVLKTPPNRSIPFRHNDEAYELPSSTVQCQNHPPPRRQHPTLFPPLHTHDTHKPGT